MNNLYNKKERAAFLTGMCGQNIIYAVMSTGLSFYFQSVIFLPAAAISVITVISKIIEFISDPVMGHFIDRTNTRFGKCRPYLLYSPLPICILSLLTFLNYRYGNGNPPAKNIFIILWAGVSFILFGISYSVGDVALWSFPSLMTRNSESRNRLLADAKIVASVSGSLIVLTVLQASQSAGNVLAQRTDSNARAMQAGTMLVCCSLIIFGSILFQITGYFVNERVQPVRNKGSVKENFRVMWTCRPFRLIMISGLLRSPYMLINLVQNVIYVYYFGNNGQEPYIKYMLVSGSFSMAGQLIGNGITPKLVRRYSKSRLTVIFSVVSAISSAGIFLLYLIFPHNLCDFVPFMLFSALTFVCSFGMGIVFAIQSFMIGDAVDYEEKQNSVRHDALFFSGQSLLIKMATGISSVISGIVYSAVHFSGENISRINEALYNGASFRSDPGFEKYTMPIFFLFSGIPAIGFLLGAIPVKRYADYE